MIQRYERKDPWEHIPFDDDAFVIDVDVVFEVLGWIFLGACFLGLVVGFMAMPEVV